MAECGDGAVRRVVVLLMMLWSAALHAGNPRYVAGTQWTNVGKPMGWYRNDVQYFVDAGALSSAVNHDAAVALVDAAAAVWNLSGLPLSLKNGGSLAEDVNADTVYVGASGLIWPQDVTSSNYAAKQIAVVLDADGAVTDALMGAGASDPSNCRTSAVTESVDLFVQPGKIAHAVIVVNGRCSGAVAEQQLQLKYQLMRVFGRVLGLGWSQVNDNVFTGTPAPTYQQQMHWPIMHPMDILCGPYTYQCLPQPFMLREDDVAAMWMLYADATSSYVTANAVAVTGSLGFPGGIPMSGVNVVIRRYQRWGAYGTDAYQDVATVSGYGLSQNRGTPVTGPSSDAVGISGSTATATTAGFDMGAVTMTTGNSFSFSSEAVNPLYVGEFAVGSYRMGSPSLSGSSLAITTGGYLAGGRMSIPVVVADASSDCSTGQDGTESTPATLSSDGFWSGRLCGVGHSSWITFGVKAGRTATVEVIATDETGAASQRKAMPLLGVWHASDATGSLPGIARMAVAFNSARTGMTQLRVPFAAAESVRLAVADARGDGRPDYSYRARVLYADAVSPSRLAAAGGTIAITGVGFTASCTVTVGGVSARVTRVSATELDALVPALSAGTKDVVVTDLTTGATTVMSSALVYGGATTDVLAWTVSLPATAAVGTPVSIGVRLTDASGVPLKSGVVILAVLTGNGNLAACNLAQCMLTTDTNGVVQTTVVATAAGVVIVNASNTGGAYVQGSFTATMVARTITLVRPTEYVAAGSGASFAPAVTLTENGAASAGTAVAWTSSSVRVVLSSASLLSNASGAASVAATGALRDNEAATVQACAWVSVCATQSLIGVPAANLRMAAVHGDGQSVSMADSLGNVVLRVVDTAGHPVAGAPVALYQAVMGWQPPCTAGRCAAAPMYGKATSTTMSDDDGLVTVTPLQYANTAAVTKITASVGTQGAITVTLEKAP